MRCAAQCDGGGTVLRGAPLGAMLAARFCAVRRSVRRWRRGSMRGAAGYDSGGAVSCGAPLGAMLAARFHVVRRWVCRWRRGVCLLNIRDPGSAIIIVVCQGLLSFRNPGISQKVLFARGVSILSTPGISLKSSSARVVFHSATLAFLKKSYLPGVFPRYPPLANR